MASIFDGLSSLTNTVFGDLVSVTPEGQATRDIQAVFRERPTTVLTEDGHEIVTVVPTLRAPADILADLLPGGTVSPGNGKTYRCIAPMTTGSPASDGALIIQ